MLGAPNEHLFGQQNTRSTTEHMFDTGTHVRQANVRSTNKHLFEQRTHVLKQNNYPNIRIKPVRNRPHPHTKETASLIVCGAMKTRPHPEVPSPAPLPIRALGFLLGLAAAAGLLAAGVWGAWWVAGVGDLFEWSELFWLGVGYVVFRSLDTALWGRTREQSRVGLSVRR